MALDFKVLPFNTGTATGSLPVTGVGFQPKAIIFLANVRAGTADAVGSSDHFRMMGFVESSTAERVVSNAADDNVNPSNERRVQENDSCVRKQLNGSGTNDGEADFTSFDLDGFTLNRSTAFGVDMRVIALCFGGSIITNVAVNNFTTAGATGNQDITNVGFQPDVVFFLSNIRNAFATDAADSDLTFGVAVSASEEGVLASRGNDGDSTTQCRVYNFGAECLAEITTSNPTARAEFVTFLSNGFRINWIESNPAVIVSYLAIKGGDWSVSSVNTQTDTVTDIVASGLGFQPSGAFMFGHNNAQSTQDASNTDDHTSFGAWDSPTSRACVSVRNEHNIAAPTNVGTLIEHDEVYGAITDAGAVSALMDIKSRDADGFTCIMDDADSSAKFVQYVAFGPFADVAVDIGAQSVQFGANPLVDGVDL